MAAPGSVITVFVTNLSKVRESLTVDPEMKVKEFKDLVRQKMEVPAQFRLGYQGKPLALKQTLTGGGVTNAAEIWVSTNAPTIQLSGYDQALGRVNRGVQLSGSIKHAIHAASTELQRNMNKRANDIEEQIAESKGIAIATQKQVAATQAQVAVVHNILQGGETTRAPGQTTLERTKQIKLQKTALENERMSLAKEKADEKHVIMETRANEQDARDKARIEDMAIATDAAQKMYRDLTDEELEKNRKATIKAYATEKKRRLEAVGGPPAPKKLRKNSKAAKKQAALDAAAEAATDQPHAAASASHEGDDTR